MTQRTNPQPDRVSDFTRHLQSTPKKVKFALEKHSVEIRTKVILVTVINLLATYFAVAACGVKVTFVAILLNLILNVTLTYLIFSISRRIILTVKDMS